MSNGGGDPFAPNTFAEFIGQNLAKRELMLEVIAAAKHQRRLADILLYGPPGLGKTVVSFVLANELGGLSSTGTPLYVHQSTGAEFDTPKKLVSAFQSIPEDPRGAIWLIDEVDGINRTASYSLHTLMTHGHILWEGKQIGVNPVTVIGTTNHMADVPKALKSRFSVKIRLDYYNPGELARIAELAAARLGLVMQPEAAKIAGEFAGGEPRKIVRSILRNAQNLIQKNETEITTATVGEAIKLSGLMPEGLSGPQVRYLVYLAQCPRFKAGLNSISAALGEDPKDVQFEYEPYLIYRALTSVGQGGRQLTTGGLVYLKGLPTYLEDKS